MHGLAATFLFVDNHFDPYYSTNVISNTVHHRAIYIYKAVAPYRLPACLLLAQQESKIVQYLDWKFNSFAIGHNEQTLLHASTAVI